MTNSTKLPPASPRRAAAEPETEAARPRRRGERVDFASQAFFPDPADRAIIKSVLWFFAPLGFLALPVVLGIPVPRVVLYGVAVLWGLAMLIKSRSNPDLMIATMLFYLPFAGIFKVPLLPGLNGTNLLLLCGLFIAVAHASAQRQPMFPRRTGFGLVLLWAFLSILSGVTIGFVPGGMSHLIGTEFNNYKAWIDQFIVYFILYSLVRDKAQARRVLLYMMCGAVLIMLYGAVEMVEKMGRSTLDASRVGGTLSQPNDYGGLLVYSFAPVLAIFLMKMHQLKAWLVAPYFLLYVKVLISTFSRGAYAGFVLMGLAVGWLRGKGFMMFWGIAALVVVLAVPQVIPDSVRARLGHTQGNTVTKRLDKSSETRLILWSAAGEMMAESPLLGKGFKAFPLLKARYTQYQVREADPHNMFLYVGSQMGLPALLVFLGLFFFILKTGWYVAANTDDILVRATGMAGGGMVAGLFVVNMFGSRMVNVEFTCYFWVILVMIQVHAQDLLSNARSLKKLKFATPEHGLRPQPVGRGALPQARRPGPLGQPLAAAQSRKALPPHKGIPAARGSRPADTQQPKPPLTSPPARATRPKPRTLPRGANPGAKGPLGRR